MYHRVVASVEAFEKEMNDTTRIMPIGLHPHLMGEPHRINYLERMLDDLTARDDVVFMNGGEIADWFIQVDRDSA